MCPNCRTPNKSRMICRYCSHDHNHWYLQDREFTKKDEYCLNHPKVVTTHFCSKCDRYFCKECVTYGGYIILAGCDWYICSECKKFRDEPIKNPKPDLCAFHPIGENKVSTHKCPDCHRNICDTCISFAPRCKKCNTPFCLGGCGTYYTSRGVCNSCRGTLKWWDIFKYPFDST